MTKDELEKYARDNRKRLEEQEVKLGDVVEVLVGQFAGEKGVIVGIIACGNDYADPYYEIDMDCDVPDKYKCRKTLITPNNVIGGLSAYEFKVVGNRAPKRLTDEIKVGDRVNTPQGEGKVVSATDSHIFVQLDNGDLWFNGIHEPTKLEDKPTCEISPNDIVRLKSDTPREYYANISRYYETMPFEVGTISKKSGGEWMADIAACDRDVSLYIPVRFLEPYYTAEDVRRMEEDLQREKEQHLREHSGKTNDPIKDIADMMEEYRKGFAKITSELVDFDWQQYRVELASKIAVAYAEKGRYKPSEIGEFAVRVANDVVDNLKKHEV